jgi:hypothetical protein
LCVRRTLLAKQVLKDVQELVEDEEEGKTKRNREIYREGKEVKRKYSMKERKTKGRKIKESEINCHLSMTRHGVEICNWIY